MTTGHWVKSPTSPTRLATTFVGKPVMFVSLFVLDPQSEFYFAEKKERVAMKKPYQIESQRAVKRLEKMAAEGEPGGTDGFCRWPRWWAGCGAEHIRLEMDVQQ